MGTLFYGQAGSISGTVYGPEGKRLADGTVWIEGGSSCITSDSGNYSFPDLAAGKMVIMVSVLGYRSIKDSLFIEPGQHLRRDLILHGASAELSKIIIAAKSNVRELLESTTSVVVLETGDLQARNNNTSDVIKRIAGVNVRQMGGFGSEATISIIGISGKQVKVFLDGLPLAYFGSGLGFNTLPVNLMERIEVYKGVVPVWLGADALGGAINVVTRRDYGSYFNAAYTFGSYGTHKTALVDKKITMSKMIFSIVTLLSSLALDAQKTTTFPPPAIPLEVRAVKAKKTIKIDGVLDENDWQNAPVTDNFFRVEPNQGGEYRYGTEVRFLYDDKNLYVGAFCHDSLGLKGIRVQDLRRDFLFGENDIIAIQLDAQNTKQYAVSFQTTPYGNQRDAQIFNDNNTDNNWNALWYVKTQRSANGYYAEFAIPFKSLRYDKPAGGEPVTWGLTMYRLARREYELTYFPAIPQAYSPYRMTYAAKLTELEVPPPSANIRIEPYSLYQFEESKSGTTITASGKNFKVGGDVKWAISPEAVLDLTINTDFAQADVDRAVNNLERFNIFFPERRQFFLENSGIWAGASDFTVVPFFSRKIGLQGGFNAEPAPLDVGARFTNKNENRTLAGLYVHQRETDNSAAANFGIFRYSKNYGNENNTGVMLTHRLDESYSELGLDQANNTTFTVDGLIRPRDELTLEYLATASYDEATDTRGVAGKLFAGYQANNFYAGWLTNFVSRDYLPGTGFVFQNDVIRHNPGGYYIWRPENIKWIRRWDPGFFVDYYHDFENPGKFQQASINIFPIFTWFKDNSFIEASITPTWQNINFDFAPLGLEINPGRYFYNRYLLRYNSDLSRKLSGSVSYSWGSFYDGKRDFVNAGFRYAPLPHISLSIDYEHNTLNNIGVVGEELETDLYTTSLRLALNPKVQLSTFYQYNSFDEQGRWNVRFNWEYMPLSFIYLVFNDTQTDIFDPVQHSTQFISKVTFLKQL